MGLVLYDGKVAKWDCFLKQGGDDSLFGISEMYVERFLKEFQRHYCTQEN